ncbi:DinB family protein [Robertkochia solimangrovi]|uniref:DinB family protein n=1 Tax=Robertkochia solimangrovi TaxID=2213046 RepID=UPI00117C73F5|nr:DinB family protein [Robertkochia solimangrovi]TRZ45958.1 DinB family protein [Robertkochia solimangrovi]
MKRTLLILTMIISSKAMSQQSTIDAFLEKWQNSKAYLLEIAAAVPEDNYDFSPTEREMNIKEQLVHIRGNMIWLSTTYFTKTPADKAAISINPGTKQELIDELTKSFDSVSDAIRATDPETLDETVEFFAGPKSKLQILNLLQDHVTHHRGQLIVYLNLLEIKPPKYRGW